MGSQAEEADEDVLAWRPLESVRNLDGDFEHVVWERFDGGGEADSVVIVRSHDPDEPGCAVQSEGSPKVVPIYEERLILKTCWFIERTTRLE